MYAKKPQPQYVGSCSLMHCTIGPSGNLLQFPTSVVRHKTATAILGTLPHSPEFIESGLPLFDFARVEVQPDQDSITRLDEFRQNFANIDESLFEVLHENLTTESSAQSYQYEFFFIKGVVRLVSRDYINILNQDIGSFFGYCRDRALENASFEMHRNGIRQVGQLVKMSKSEIMPYLGHRKTYLTRLEIHLATFGLEINTPVYWWKPTVAA